MGRFPQAVIVFAAIATQVHCSTAASSTATPGPDGGREDRDVAVDAVAVDVVVLDASDVGASETNDAGVDATTETTDAAAPGLDASVPVGKVPMFVAEGYFGRTIVSCDDGQTWVGNHSWDIDDDGLWCGPDGGANCSDTACYFLVNGTCQQTPCCNDTPDFSHGIAFGQGAFVANWGHGMPGVIRRSTNGLDWTTTSTNAQYGDLAYGGGRFVASSLTPLWSADGITWSDGGAANFATADGGKPDVVRVVGYGDYNGAGRFVAIAEPPGPAFLVSSDGAQTWWEPTVVPSNCAAGGLGTYGRVISGNGVILIVDEYGNACRTTDGGNTWSVSPIGVTGVHAWAVWTGGQFVVWGADADPGGYIAAAYRLTSPDGATWTKTPLTSPVGLGPVAVGTSGTFVAINGVFDGYGQQAFLRSTDGLTWEQLPAAAVVQSHPLYYVTFGYADPSATCPLTQLLDGGSE